jgi:hypothetical protein
VQFSLHTVRQLGSDAEPDRLLPACVRKGMVLPAIPAGSRLPNVPAETSP